MRSANTLQVQGRQAGLGHRVDDVRCGGGDERNALTRQPLPGCSGHVTDLQLLTAVPSLSVGCDLLLALSLMVEGSSKRSSPSGNRTSRPGEGARLKW